MTIKAHVTDRGALAARAPSDLAMYLRSRDWVTQVKTRKSVVWTKDVGGETFEVEQPMDLSLRDYASRVSDVLKVLAIVENRSELDVLVDISNVSTDVHSVRTFPADAAPGTIGLDDGVEAFESLRNLVVSAACAVSAEQPQAVQPARKPAEVQRFLREVRFGPSREGSFILSVHTPVPPRLAAGQASLFEDEANADFEPAEPYERRVSLKVYDAVRAAHAAATDALVGADGIDAFTRSVRAGVSANLCEALVGLAGEEKRPFEVSLTLAASRPSRARKLPPVSFRRDQIPILQAAAQEFRERIPDEGVLVSGNVVRLYREGSNTGEITIAGAVEGDERLRRVWMDLVASDYAEAVRAHKEMANVSARGDLYRRGNRLYLKNLVAFHVHPGSDDT